MISLKYLSNVFVSFVIGALVTLFAIFSGKEINLLALAVSFLLVIAYIPLVVLKLPVFKKYYTNELGGYDETHHNFTNGRAAPVMVAIVVGATNTLVFALFDAANPEIYGFLCSVVAIVNSFYYEPRY